MNFRYIGTKGLDHSKLKPKQLSDVQYLLDNWIEIRVHGSSGRYIVMDKRYDTDDAVFETLNEAIKEGRRQVMDH